MGGLPNSEAGKSRKKWWVVRVPIGEGAHRFVPLERLGFDYQENQGVSGREGGQRSRAEGRKCWAV